MSSMKQNEITSIYGTLNNYDSLCHSRTGSRLSSHHEDRIRTPSIIRDQCTYGTMKNHCGITEASAVEMINEDNPVYLNNEDLAKLPIPYQSNQRQHLIGANPRYGHNSWCYPDMSDPDFVNTQHHGQHHAPNQQAVYNKQLVVFQPKRQRTIREISRRFLIITVNLANDIAQRMQRTLRDKRRKVNHHRNATNSHFRF